MNKKQFLFYFSFLFVNLTYAQWTNRNTGQGDFSDKFTAIVTDNSGNSYLCGSTINVSTSSDILLVKLNPAGDTLWTKIYNGPGNGIDEANAIALDNLGNIVVTGSQRGNGTGTDLITLKYDNNGVFQWAVPYLFGSDESDRGVSVAIDASNNIFVTGQTDTDASAFTNDDIITLKYDPSGNVLWNVTKNGVGNAIDRPSKIGIDPSGNPVITGRTDNGVDDDYITIKYNSLNGAILWEQTIDRTHNDRASDLVINQTNGNVYITGRSKNLTYDYLTVAYDNNGVFLWQKVFDYIDDDRATNIAINPSGEIYVTGQSDFDGSVNYNYNITSLKYSALGVQLWSKTYVGTGLGDDIPTGIYVDNNGNSFVTGYSDKNTTSLISNDIVVLKYDNAGVLSWSNTFNSNATNDDFSAGITVDINGNTLVCGYSEFIPQKNGTVLKYDAAGLLQWQKEYDGIGDNSNNTHAVAVDAARNVYVAGYSVEYGTDRNFTLQKINPSGATEWIRTINGTSSGSSDEAYAVAVDAGGFIYVGGYTKNLNNSYDFTLYKYSPVGSYIWSQVYNNPLANESDKAVSLAINDLGTRIYLTGKSDSDAGLLTNYDALTVSWTNNGTFVFAKRFNGTSNGEDVAKIVKVSKLGNVYIAGNTFNGTNNDFFILKYNPSGVQQWVSFYNGTGQDDVYSMVLDTNENIYLTGAGENNVLGDTDLVVVKYNSLGVFQWERRYDGLSHGFDVGKSINLDTLGNIVVCGSTDSDSDLLTLNDDIVTLKYDQSGTLIWSKLYDNLVNQNDEACEIGVDQDNNIFVTGQSDNYGDGNLRYDFTTLKYTNDGILDSVYTYNGTGDAKDVPNAMFIYGNDVYVTGGSYNENFQRDMLTIRYTGTQIANLELLTNELNTCLLFPNPMEEFAYLDISSLNRKQDEKLTISILNIEGKTVKTIYSQKAENILISRENLNVGMYFIQINSLSKNYGNLKVIIK